MAFEMAKRKEELARKKRLTQEALAAKQRGEDRKASKERTIESVDKVNKLLQTIQEYNIQVNTIVRTSNEIPPEPEPDRKEKESIVEFSVSESE